MSGITDGELRKLTGALVKGVHGLLSDDGLRLWEGMVKLVHWKTRNTIDMMDELAGEQIPEHLALMICDLLRSKTVVVDRRFYERLTERFMEILAGGDA